GLFHSQGGQARVPTPLRQKKPCCLRNRVQGLPCGDESTGVRRNDTHASSRKPRAGRGGDTHKTTSPAIGFPMQSAGVNAADHVGKSKYPSIPAQGMQRQKPKEI